MTSAILPRTALLLIFLIPLITYAENETQIDKFAEAKAEPQGDIPVIKLEDIIAGKHSGKKSKDIKKKNINKKDISISTATKKQNKKNSKAVESTKNSYSVDLEKAYFLLMNSDNKPEKANNKVIGSPVAVANTGNIVASRGRTAGWLYLGKFIQGQWNNKNNQTLGLHATLPETGKYYSLRIDCNIRNNYPSKSGMPAIRQVLGKGSKVRVLDIHNSGQSGHYWAKVEW
jgi:hypothetical protein